MAYKILIIDDHPETRSIIEHVLKQQGHIVVTAENGQQGLELANREQPHIILCDYMMPVMDGVETITNLRKKQEFDNVPIIMFTAVDDPQQKLAAFDAGADDYLNKPTEPPELIDRVEMLLESAYGSLPEPAANADGRTHLHAGPLLPPLPADVASVTAAKAKQLVAVLGVCGGTGTTTMAINLAAMLAKAGTTTTLVDFDLPRGHISLYLNQKSAGGLNTLATMSAAAAATEISSQVVAYADNLHLLLTHLNIDGRYPTLSSPQASTMLHTLSQTRQTIIVDLGNTFNEIARNTVETADRIVICLRPERIALVAARQLITQLKKIRFPQTAIDVVLMDFSGGTVNLPKTAVEGFLGYPISMTIVISSREMAHAVNKAKPLVTLNKESKASRAFQQFAQQFVRIRDKT